MLKKCVCFAAAISVMLLIFLFIYENNNDDISLYTHKDPSFSFAVYDVGNENELKIRIVDYSLKDAFFYQEEEPDTTHDISYIKTELPSQYEFSKDNVVLYEGHIQHQLIPQYRDQYEISQKNIDFYVFGKKKCFPNIIELSNGDKLMVYKKFRNIYIAKV